MQGMPPRHTDQKGRLRVLYELRSDWGVRVMV